MVDVLGRTQDGTRGPDDDGPRPAPHADRIACRIWQGARCPDACLRLASGLGGSRCGAVEPNHRLDSRLQSSQTRSRRHRATNGASVPGKSCEWSGVTTVFRLNSAQANPIALEALNRIAALYVIEVHGRDMTVQARRRHSNVARNSETQWPGSRCVVARYAGKTTGLLEQRN